MVYAYIDTAGLNHDEVTLVAARSGFVKPGERSLDHVEQRWLVLGDFAINLVTEIACSSGQII